MKVLKEITDRYSPMIFSEKEISEEDLQSLFEAARWASSSYNGQPWRFIYATKNDKEGYKNLFFTLNEYNKIWAQSAPVLVLIASKKTLDLNGEIDHHSWYGTGMALGNLLAQATSLGILAHQMGGYFPDIARQVTGLPDDYEPVAMMALGYQGDRSLLRDDMRERAEAPRTRLELDTIAMRNSWGL